MPLLDVDVRKRREDPRGTDAGAATAPEVGAARRPPRPFPWWGASLGVAVLAGVVLRFVAPAALWLDEAQSVAIAELPPTSLIDALRSDGAPPLWYFVLHGWIRIAGDGPAAVRLLPMLLGVLALPLAWRAGTVVGGRRTAAVATVLVATSPFAIRYSSEARMYSLVLVLVLLGLILALDRTSALTVRRGAGLAVVSGALLLTHYWGALLLVGAVVAAVVDAVRRPERRPEVRRLVIAIATGGLLFLPWVPSFLHQLAHTGAPWAVPPGGSIVEATVRGFAGSGDAGSVLGVILLSAIGVALASPFLDGGRRRRPLPAVLVAVSLATLALGAASLEWSGDGFAPRHATVVLAPLLLAIATAIGELRPPVAALVVSTMALLGLAIATPAARDDRTQAPAIAAVLRSRVQPGDVVAACPDQLTPALALLLEPQLRPRRVVPPGSPPERVDWTGYARRVRAVDPGRFAAALDADAGSATVWLVSSPNYVGVGKRCAAVERSLRRLRPDAERSVRLRRAVFESATLWRAPASPLPAPLEAP